MSHAIIPRRGTHEHAIQKLVDETEAPHETVAAIYKEELAQMDARASVKQFLPLIISRRVMAVLRERDFIH